MGFRHHLRAGLGRVERAAEAGRDVDRKDLGIGCSQFAIDGRKVARRWLRGRREALRVCI